MRRETSISIGDSIGVGDQVTLVREGRQIVDQDTGKVLGSRERVLGALEITSANASFSIARRVGGAFDVNTGDRAKISLTVSQANSSKQREKKGRRI